MMPAGRQNFAISQWVGSKFKGLASSINTKLQNIHVIVLASKVTCQSLR